MELTNKNIVLLTINAKWIHPSLALRLLKANLGAIETEIEMSCEIIELNLRQSLPEKLEALVAAKPGILGISVSIWNHSETVNLLKALEEKKLAEKPVVILGGAEVSHLPPQSEIFAFADYVVCGEGEAAFAELCGEILKNGVMRKNSPPVFIHAQPVATEKIKPAYHLYTDEDLAKKLIYVEASRGCPFSCAFCLSAVKNTPSGAGGTTREFPVETFLAQMDELVMRGAKTFKFLDRTFNSNTKRALQIIDFFLQKIDERKEPPLVVHFEMVPFLFSSELLNALARFPPGTLRLEIGLQTFKAQTAALIGRACKPAQELETLRLLREKTNAIIHADLIAGLPGEDINSFAQGFDRLWDALFANRPQSSIEIQVGILKLLPGAPIAKYNESHGMRYNPAPPYEVLETAAVSTLDIDRLKNFGRFWEMIVNRNLALSLVRNNVSGSVFWRFMALSDFLAGRFGRNWGIDKNELKKAIEEFEKE
ncbi:MAG: DUF4080 domain-containing protein [Spirochaetes bacterium]|nr:DUF4080 domain-containing protein [Spirochaetota bacterium]